MTIMVEIKAPTTCTNIKKHHLTVKLEDFEILSKGFRQRKFKGKISEALFIK